MFFLIFYVIFNFSELFYPKSYITLVTGDILCILHGIHTSIQASKDVSLEFISRLIGKLCIAGYSGRLQIIMVYYNFGAVVVVIVW